MILTVKTLQNKKYDVNIEPGDTIAQIKEKIHTQLDLGEPASQKLIHHGKILKDDDTANSVGLKDKDFVVIMIAKTKKSKKSDKSTDEEETEQNESQPQQPSPQSQPQQPQQPPQQQQPSQQQPQQNVQNAASNLVTGRDYEAVIANLMGMGFEHDQVVRALRAAFNNPDRAVEYLINGIPANIEQPQQEQPPQLVQGRPQQQQPQQPQQPQLGPGLGVAVNQPQGNQAQPAPRVPNVMQANPQMIAALVGQLAQQNPQLLQAIQQNPQALQQILQDPNVLQQMMPLLMQGMEQEVDGDDDGGDESAVQVTQEEKEAIDRLVAMGFPEQVAFEAYMVCGKDEQLALNYLFDNQNNNDNLENDDYQDPQ